MENMIKGLILGVVSILVFALILNVVLNIYEPTAISNGVKAATNQTITVDGTAYTVAGTGQTAQAVAQSTHDQFTTIRTVANVLLGIVFLVLVILGCVELFSKKKHY